MKLILIFCIYFVLWLINLFLFKKLINWRYLFLQIILLFFGYFLTISIVLQWKWANPTTYLNLIFQPIKIRIFGS